MIVLLVSGCGAPPPQTSAAGPHLIRVKLPPALTPLRSAMQACIQQQPDLALFEEDQASLADLRFTFGEPGALDTFAAQVASDQLVVVVNPHNPLHSLSAAQLSGVFSGRISGWADVQAGPDSITLWTYPPGDPLRETFDRLVLKNSPTPGAAFLAPSPAEMLQAIAADPQAIGYLPRSWLDDTLKTVTLDPETRQAFIQPILALAPAEPQGPLRQFLACLQSGAGHLQIEKDYLAPAQGG